VFRDKRSLGRDLPIEAVTCLTEWFSGSHYSPFTDCQTNRQSMSKKQYTNDSPIESLTSEAARQRWELFHRAIAHAKKLNNASHAEVDTHTADADAPGPFLTIVR